MKFVSFSKGGTASYGVVSDGVVADVGSSLRSQFADLKSLIANGGIEAAKNAVSAAPKFPLADVTLLPVIPNPGKIFCIGLNYEEHRLETGRVKTAHPAVFLRFADSLASADEAVLIPEVSADIDFEGELAVIIGKGGRYIPVEDALKHVAGYACFNDITARDWQRHTTQFTAGKNFPKTGPFGPWIVTADEIPDPQALELTTTLNGTVVQHTGTDLMIFSVAELINYCSSFSPLSPGDVIATGTPGGVGFKREPPLYMRAGDVIEVKISNIATLTNKLAPEPAQ